MVKYRISWRAVETGRTGHGDPVFNTYAAAQIVADNANMAWSGIIHMVEPVEVSVDDLNKEELQNGMV